MNTIKGSHPQTFAVITTDNSTKNMGKLLNNIYIYELAKNLSSIRTVFEIPFLIVLH